MEVKLAPIGLSSTLKVMAESLSKAVTVRKKTSPSVTLIQLGTSMNFGGKLSETEL